jgi:phenazine biosynthesis protein phzE
MDSAILIRTADIDATGHMRIGVGATLVRDSDPASEAAETRAKAAGLLDALRGRPPAAVGTASTADIPLDEHPAIRRALAERNTPLADFWFDDPDDRDRDRTVADLKGRRVLVIDAEDTFTAMARQVLAALGFDVDVRRFDEDYELAGHDLVVVGPGPGDPRDHDDPKIAHLRDVTKRLLASDVPFLSVCLGHQVLSTVLGLPLEPIPVPNQGTQRTIEFLGRRELVGFYNTFAASCPSDEIDCPARDGTIEVFREERSDEVHGLRGPGFASVQFHPESVLSRGGVRILRDTLRGVLSERGAH